MISFDIKKKKLRRRLKEHKQLILSSSGVDTKQLAREVAEIVLNALKSILEIKIIKETQTVQEETNEPVVERKRTLPAEVVEGGNLFKERKTTRKGDIINTKKGGK